MKRTFEITSRATGKHIRFEAEYTCKMVDRYLDSSHIIKASTQEESEVGSLLVVYIDGQEVARTESPTFWHLIDYRGKKMIHGPRLIFTDDADAQAYESWINSVIEAGTDESVIKARAEKKQKELENRLSYARKVVEKAEAQADIPEKAEAVRRMNSYNNAVNEGGEGYVPYIYSLEEYQSAISFIRENA